MNLADIVNMLVRPEQFIIQKRSCVHRPAQIHDEVLALDNYLILFDGVPQDRL